MKSSEVKWSQVIVWKSYSVTILKSSQIILCSIFFCFISFLFIVLFYFQLFSTLQQPTCSIHQLPSPTLPQALQSLQTIPHFHFDIFSKIESIFQSEFFADAAHMFCIVNLFCFCTGIFEKKMRWFDWVSSQESLDMRQKNLMCFHTGIF